VGRREKEVEGSEGEKGELRNVSENTWALSNSTSTQDDCILVAVETVTIIFWHQLVNILTYVLGLLVSRQSSVDVEQLQLSWWSAFSWVFTIYYRQLYCTLAKRIMSSSLCSNLRQRQTGVLALRIRLTTTNVETAHGKRQTIYSAVTRSNWCNNLCLFLLHKTVTQ